MSLKRILVVDDEHAFASTLVYILNNSGYKATAMKSESNALGFIRQQIKAGTPINLLVTDLQMPGMGGFGLIDEIERLRIALPIIGMSAYGDWITSIEAIWLGCVDFLEKPLTPEEILSRIKLALEKEAKIDQYTIGDAECRTMN